LQKIIIPVHSESQSEADDQDGTIEKGEKNSSPFSQAVDDSQEKIA